MKYLFTIFIAIACQVHAEDYNVIGCRIYSMDKKMIRSFPGQLCQFLDDGSFVSGQNDNISYFDSGLKPVWTRVLHAHHQINSTGDQKSFLILSSAEHEHIRYDVLKIFDRLGNLKREFSFYKNRGAIAQELKKHGEKPKNGPIDWIREVFPTATAEFSHANSFYEISDNKSTIPAFKKGNFIVNSPVLKLIFIVDRHLKKILWSASTSKMACEVSHDAQVLRNGNILFLCNKFGPHGITRIVEFSPLAKRSVWIYPELALESPYAFENSGGVQWLPGDHILFNDLTKEPKAIEISRDGKQLWTLDYPFFDGKIGQPTSFQQVKRQDLTGFLKFNSSY